MIGYYTEHQPRTYSLLDYLVPRHGRFVVIAGRWRDRALARQFRIAFNAASRTVPAYTTILPQSLGIDASDQLSYWRRGYEAVMLSDTAYLHNPHYHTAADTADTLDYARMATADVLTNLEIQLRCRGESAKEFSWQRSTESRVDVCRHAACGMP